MRKILYSPGWGAGWSTWNSSIPTKFICEYQPIIEALEKGEDLIGEYDVYKDESLLHPSVQ